MRIFIQVLIIIIYNSAIAQNYWEPINFPDSLNTRKLNAQKEGVLFVSTGGNNEYPGLFRSQNNGKDWTQVFYDTNYIYNSANTIQYSQDYVLFIGSGTAIYRSYDDGDSFEKVYEGFCGNIKFRFSPDNSLYTVGWLYLLRSQDNGNNWDTLCDLGNMAYYADIAFGTNGEIYTVGGTYHPWGGGFYRSLDNGLTWENIGYTGEHIQSVCVNQEGHIIIGGFSSNHVYISYDKGVTWTQGGNITADVMESYCDDKLIAGRNINGGSGCWFSEDWGHTWIDLTDGVLNPRVNSISISSNNTIYIQSQKSPSFNHQLFKSINPILSTKGMRKNSEIAIFPNPTSNKLELVTELKTELKKFMVYNQSGQIVQTGKISNSSIDITNLKVGLYIIEIETGNKTIRQKIIKK